MSCAGSATTRWPWDRPAGDTLAGRGLARRTDALEPPAVTGMIAHRRASGARVLAVLRPDRLAAAGGAAPLPGAALLQATVQALGLAAPPASISGRGLSSDALLPRLRRANIGTLLLERGATDDDRALVRELLRAWPGSLLTLRGDET
jgi:hypothetical protein